MTEQEQNKKLNQHQRLITNLRERLKSIEADVEPDGRISIAFDGEGCAVARRIPNRHVDAIEDHLDRQDEKFREHDKRFDRLEHKSNQLASKLDIIIEHLTNINDLPEE